MVSGQNCVEINKETRIRLSPPSPLMALPHGTSNFLEWSPYKRAKTSHEFDDLHMHFKHMIVDPARTLSFVFKIYSIEFKVLRC